MRYKAVVTLFLLLFACQSFILAQEKQTSTWKGFQRYDFQFEGRDARLVMPKQALAGKPWIWRARFPNWHTEADSLLLTEGFHLAYINTNNGFGSPESMEIWDRFYSFLQKEYQLHPKVALMGVSRGGLFVYNWAKRNVDKVSCIYAEAPVCDFKSWPGGFGDGDGNPKSWEQLKKAYHFSTDEAAKAYANNPIDNLALLADAKIPILHMIGLEDKVVPPEENTFRLVDRYLKLGGIATVVPCTKGKQSLQGHHFEIETPRMVADFIQYHTRPLLPIHASDYHTLYDGLVNSQLRFEREQKGRIAFLGGSITYNHGWRDSITNYFLKRFPDTEFEFIEAGIPSMGTTPAAFRLQRDVLSKGEIDLLFEEAAVNDATNGRTQTEQIRALEGIVRHLRRENPAMDIVLMHFVDPEKMASYNNGQIPDVIQNHNRVAHHYRIPTINLAKEVTDRINHGEFTWKADFKNLHPSPFGQGIYARSMITFLDHALPSNVAEDDKITNHPLPTPIDLANYSKGHLLDIHTLKLKKGWTIEPLWNPQDGKGLRANYFDVPMLISQTPGAVMKLKFTGTAIGVAVAAGPDAGIIEYRIDKGTWRSLNLATRWSQSLHLPWYYTLAANLHPAKHQLELRLATKQDRKACRIRYFYINQL